jgi:hypothetical protein
MNLNDDDDGSGGGDTYTPNGRLGPAQGDTRLWRPPPRASGRPPPADQMPAAWAAGALDLVAGRPAAR